MTRFNPPPGWPVPPPDWTPPPGWQPDPSLPPAPAGWHFWIDDSGNPAAPAPHAPPQHQQSQPPFAAHGAPQYGGAPASYGAYSAAPSGNTGTNPYAQGGYQGGPPAGGPGPARRNPALIGVAVGVVVVVLGLLGWGVWALTSPDDDPTQETATDEPTTDEPTDEPTTDEPTDEPSTEEPTDDATTSGGGTSTEGMVDLSSDEPAIVVGYESSDPIAELRMVSYENGWQPDPNSLMCSEADSGNYLYVEIEVTTLPALADQTSVNYDFSPFDFGVELDGSRLNSSPFTTSIFCLDGSGSPGTMRAGETATAQLLFDVTADVSAVTYEGLFGLSGGDSYRWVLADQ